MTGGFYGYLQKRKNSGRDRKGHGQDQRAAGSEIVEIVRGMSVSLTDLPALLQTIKSGGTLGQNVPKSADKEDSE